MTVSMPSEHLDHGAWLAGRRLIALVESSQDAIVSKDLNGIVTSWNRAAERLFGYSAEEVIGRSITIIIPPERLAEEDLVLWAVRRGDRVEHFETLRRRKDGTLIPISLTVSPILDEEGVVIGASKIARDISERVRAERERAQLMEALQEANRVKDEFLATLSHEIRTPLNAILGYSQLLQTTLFDEQKRRRAVDVIQRNARTLTQIIEDVLDVSRITSGRLRLKIEAVELPEIVRDAVDRTTCGRCQGGAARDRRAAWRLGCGGRPRTAAAGAVEPADQRGEIHPPAVAGFSSRYVRRIEARR